MGNLVISSRRAYESIAQFINSLAVKLQAGAAMPRIQFLISVKRDKSCQYVFQVGPR